MERDGFSVLIATRTYDIITTSYVDCARHIDNIDENIVIRHERYVNNDGEYARNIVFYFLRNPQESQGFTDTRIKYAVHNSNRYVCVCGYYKHIWNTLLFFS